MSYRPEFKKVYPLYKIDDVIHMGSRHNFVEIPDEDGSIYDLLKLMDGTRTVDEIKQKIIEKYPHVTSEEVDEAIAEIDRLGFISDASALERTQLTEKERDRFKGNLNFFSFFANSRQSNFEIQEKLNNSTVTIIGMGGFGTNILYNMAGLGVKNVRIADFDRVELSNLNRQLLFNEKDIGRPKIEVAKEFMADFHSDMKIETTLMKVESSKQVEELAAGSDLVLLAADEPMIKLAQWVNKACVKLNIPYIVGGMGIDSGEFYSIIPGQSGCVDCMHLYFLKTNENYEAATRQLLDFRPPNWGTAPGVAIITAMISLEATKILTGVGPLVANGKMYSINVHTLESEILHEWERYEEECPTCGAGKHEYASFFDLFKEKVTGGHPS